MAKNLGNFTFAANFKVKIAEAIDPRMVAGSKADLIKKDNWPLDGDSIYVYKGLIVDCGEDGVYRLVDVDKVLSPDYSGWQRVDFGGADAVFKYMGSYSTIDAIPEPRHEGYVYNISQEFTYNGKKYPEGTNIVWNGNDWDPLGGSVDLTNYVQTQQVIDIVDTKLNPLSMGVGELQTQVGELQTQLNTKADTSYVQEQLRLINEDTEDQLEGLAQRIQFISDLINPENGGLDLTLINSKLTQLETDVNGINQQIAQLDIEETKQQAQSAYDTAMAVNSQIEGLRTSINDKADKSDLANLVTTERLTAEVSGLNTTIRNSIQEVTGVQESLSGELIGIKNRLNAFLDSTQIDDTVNTLLEIQQYIEQDAGMAASMIGQITALREQVDTCITEEEVNQKINDAFNWQTISED